ncbi:NAD(P)/FAD-dependent oxidoreductase [Bremerella alba]|uniref:D-amino acid dehydrogenase n=1 Tax=Bremerella alba TaxID=980252 RepID=A0A7V8V259_9BACT|nr:FAD-dependent oxidoreductase [Bremerella alba]MBA2113547.1 D-amino acid dehydrogenase [Bremerella alba]
MVVASKSIKDNLNSETKHERTVGQGQKPIVVVGGGVVGAACAYYLAMQGSPVVVIDQGTFGNACSHGNCGYVSPSHILPLCRPGAVLSSLKTLFSRNSPFKIRARLDMKMWWWLLKFALRCNQANMIEAGHARHGLLQSSRTLYQSMIDDGRLGDCEWETVGLMFVHSDRKHFESFEKTNQLIVDEFGASFERLDQAELLRREPALREVACGAWMFEGDAHLRPHLLMKSWRSLLEEQDVEIRENCEFYDLETTGNNAHAIETNQGRIEADQVIFATGAWSRMIQRKLKARIPVEPGKGYSITMQRPEICPKYPMLFEDHKVGISPTSSALRIGSTMEFAGYDSSLREDRLQLLTDTAKYYLHDPIRNPVVERWYGWRPMSCDEIPLIGRVPRYGNVWLAAGHSMLGLSMATATGKMISEMMTGQTPHLDPHPYRPSRF